MNNTTSDIDEGYVKYVSEWSEGPPLDNREISLLNEWRKPLFDAQLIGHYDELNVGFGNISVRRGDSEKFVISGTQTGHIVNTTAEHFVLVTDVDIAANSVCCVGPIQASSEALTHAALYALSDNVRAVVHVHSRTLWQRNIHVFPTTDASVSYGTPQMAREFERLWQESDFAKCGIAVMAGHEEGLVSVGGTLQQAAERMLHLAAENVF